MWVLAALKVMGRRTAVCDRSTTRVGMTSVGLLAGMAFGSESAETAVGATTHYPDVPIFFEDRVREIGTNRMDHTPWPQDNMPEYGDMWGSERPFHSIMLNANDGESFMHFRTRVGMFVEDIVDKHRGQTVVVICHGGVIGAALSHIFNVGPWQRCEVWTKNTGISCFELMDHPRRETWRMHYQNRTENLALLDHSEP